MKINEIIENKPKMGNLGKGHKIWSGDKPGQPGYWADRDSADAARASGVKKGNINRFGKIWDGTNWVQKESIKVDEKERVDELVPLIPLGIAAGKAAAAAIARHGIGTIAKGTIKKGAIGDKIRQWTSKAPPDSSTPDALKTDKGIGYGKGQVDPPLAQAAKKNYPSKSNPPEVAKRTNVGPMSKLQRART